MIMLFLRLNTTPFVPVWGDMEVKSPRIPNLGRRHMASRLNIVLRRIMPKLRKMDTNKMQSYKTSLFMWLIPES
jgi:hypothetical protein